ncbi:hypothetical protein RHS01_08880 [Rhizoctonia solani]|uniref:Uncharacterized protein n=1 Tax=Rhizoctonia solani TaxID=456999 RepID=A0A8H7I6C6_9AGAM|nr:hypothetical protein RHS01_08880 [Rhizoctonia solani]
MGWEPLPLLLYGFAIHPLSYASPTTNDRVSSIGPPRLELDAIPEHAHRNPHLARLDVGDEIYAFEAWRDAGRPTWYRGYIVVYIQHTIGPQLHPTLPCPIYHPGIPPAQDNTTVVEDPQVTIGIFPATHVHIRDELPDAEGRLATIIAHSQSHPRPGLATPAGFHMATLQEEPDSPRSPLHEKPEAPRPTLKSGDETALGLVEPLVDEIASALREWHARLFTYLAKRDYRTFTSVREHIDALHLGRRQLLLGGMSSEESAALRRECVMRLVRGNVAQGLDVLVRKKADVTNWVSTIRMYAMQCALAYIDAQTQSYKPSALGPIQDLFFPPPAPALLSNPQLQSRGRKEETTRPKFHHILLDLRAFVAAPCAPGEYTELFFSLYSKAGASFVTEDFCVILNRNGVRGDETHTAGSPISNGAPSIGLARGESTDGTIGKPEAPIRTLFTDLGSHDLSEGLVLVCRIVRRGGMKLAPDGEAESPGKSGMGTIEESNTLGLGAMSEQGHGSFSSARSPRRGSEPMYKSSKSETAEDLRRPFGCAVLELDLGASTREGVGSGREYTMPIFVPVDESRFSTLHQDILRADERCMEKSPSTAIDRGKPQGRHDSRHSQNTLRRLCHTHPRKPVPAPFGAFNFEVGFPGRGVSGKTPATMRLLSSGRGISAHGLAGEFADSRKNAKEHRCARRGDGRARPTQRRSLGPSPNSGRPNTRHDPLSWIRPATAIHVPVHGALQIPHAELRRARQGQARGRGGPLVLHVSEPPRTGLCVCLSPALPGRARVRLGRDAQARVVQDGKIESVQPKDYFGAPASVPGPSTKIELAPALARAPATRDALVVRSFLVSTKYTQNATLLSLLNWEQTQDKDELASVLGKFTFVGEVEIVKFLQDIFDALFAVLVSPLNSRGELDDLVFSVLVTVLGIIQDRRFNNFQPVLDVYIDQHFSCAAAAGHMIHSMNRLQLQQLHEVGMGVTSEHLEGAFKREVLGHLSEVNKVMARTSPDIIGTQTIALQHFASILPDLSTSFSTTELVPIVTGFTNSLVSTKGKLVVWKLLMYIQFVRSFVFDDPKSRSLLVESIISWIKPHFGKFNEFTMTSAGDSDAARMRLELGGWRRRGCV